jgi:hypothetical protein
LKESRDGSLTLTSEKATATEEARKGIFGSISKGKGNTQEGIDYRINKAAVIIYICNNDCCFILFKQF